MHLYVLSAIKTPSMYNQNYSTSCKTQSSFSIKKKQYYIIISAQFMIIHDPYTCRPGLKCLHVFTIMIHYTIIFPALVSENITQNGVYSQWNKL